MANNSVKKNELSAPRAPGFTAEASLYTSRARFLQTAAQDRFGVSAVVQPQVPPRCIDGVCCRIQCWWISVGHGTSAQICKEVCSSQFSI